MPTSAIALRRGYFRLLRVSLRSLLGPWLPPEDADRTQLGEQSLSDILPAFFAHAPRVEFGEDLVDRQPRVIRAAPSPERARRRGIVTVADHGEQRHTGNRESHDARILAGGLAPVIRGQPKRARLVENDLGGGHAAHAGSS